MWFKQKCWWSLVRLSDALTCYCFTFFRQVAKIKTKIVNSGHRSVNAEKIQISCCSIAPKVAESVQVCMMLKKWNRLPITLQKFAIIDPCNAFFSLSWAYILILLPIHLHQWAFPDFSIIVLFFKKRSSSFPSTPPRLYSFPDGLLHITVSFLRSQDASSALNLSDFCEDIKAKRPFAFISACHIPQWVSSRWI